MATLAKEKILNLQPFMWAISRGIIEIGTLEAINEHMYVNMLIVIEITVRIIILFAIAGFVIYLAAIAWLCVEESKRPAQRQTKPAPESTEPDDYHIIGQSPAFPSRGWKPSMRQATI